VREGGGRMDPRGPQWSCTGGNGAQCGRVGVSNAVVVPLFGPLWGVREQRLPGQCWAETSWMVH